MCLKARRKKPQKNNNEELKGFDVWLGRHSLNIMKEGKMNKTQKRQEKDKSVTNAKVCSCCWLVNFDPERPLLNPPPKKSQKVISRSAARLCNPLQMMTIIHYLITLFWTSWNPSRRKTTTQKAKHHCPSSILCLEFWVYVCFQKRKSSSHDYTIQSSVVFILKKQSHGDNNKRGVQSRLLF